MIKFDCGRAPGLEKRVKREPEEADRTEAKVEGLGEGGGWRSALIRRPRPIQLKEQGRAPGGKGFPAEESASLRRVEGQHPYSGRVSVLAGHLQPSGETQPPPHSRVQDKDQELQEGVHSQL